jgi:predicted CXXCH cytochrome family protein
VVQRFLAAAVLMAAAVGSARALARATAAGPPAHAGATFVGANACASCHRAVHDAWTAGRHSKMLQPATTATVEGDFTQPPITLRASRYAFRVEGGRYFITESYLTGKPQEHAIEYTLGSRRVQHYLTTLADGRMIILPPSWDVQRQRWFHNLEIVRPDEDAHTLVQQWNKSCVGCHVSGEEVNYTPATASYATRWLDFGTSCERCHGPGSAHIEQYTRSPASRPVAERLIVRPTRLDPAASSTICAQCHSLRETIAPAFKAGEDYSDYFQPVLEFQGAGDRDPAYWADGRPRRFSNDAAGLWQSECFWRGGATCTTCHRDVHTPDIDKNAQLAGADNSLCTQCHRAIGEQVTAHTRHRADSAGSACVECHMPKAVVSIKSTMRDHTISAPAPENTVAFGIPNACTDCHRDKPAAWAVDAIAKTWPARRRAKLVARAEAFTGGRARSPAALDRLIAIAEDGREMPWVRANAVGYLRGYTTAAASDALLAAAQAADPLVRSTALAGLPSAFAGAHKEPARIALLAGLDDARRAVRLAALAALVNAGDGRFDAGDESRFRRVSEEFAAKAALYPDNARIQSELGLVQILSGNFDRAAAALEVSFGLERDRPSTAFLFALARLGQGRNDDARALLNAVPRTDPYYAAAQERLKALRRPTR